jgi:preprotein translocase subunit SecB
MAEDANPTFAIQRMYLKGASLEQPNAPAILLEQDSPSVDIQVGVSQQNLAEHVYEVVVSATVHAKVQDKTLFLVECEYAGIFEIAGFDNDQLRGALTVGCPQIVYPYLRAQVADLTQRAGFAPVHLSEISFQAMAEQAQAGNNAEAA